MINVDNAIKEAQHYKKEYNNDNMSSNYIKKQYCIFRVGQKYHSYEAIYGFQYHMERQRNTPNANRNIKNIRLIGSDNISKDVKKYINEENVKVRKNNVLATELLLTASPQFFNLPENEFEEWIEENINFLKKYFSHNLRYAILHLDESTPHIHVLISPRIYDKKRNKYILSNKQYFDGKDKLSLWQDRYAEHMNKKFPSLNRGIRRSKAKHIDIQQYYTLVKNNLDIKDFNSIVAKAKQSEMLEKQNNDLKEVLEVIEYNYSKIEEYVQGLRRDLDYVQKDSDLYKSILQEVVREKKINKKDMEKILENIEFDKEKENKKKA